VTATDGRLQQSQITPATATDAATYAESPCSILKLQEEECSRCPYAMYGQPAADANKGDW